jgi:hypothetical protein
MKRLVLTFLVLFAATTLFAGGKECETKTAKKNVELTGTLQKAAAEDGEKVYFRVANDGGKYVVCHKSKAAALKLADGSNATVRVKGTLVTCGDGQELMIEEAKKI